MLFVFAPHDNPKKQGFLCKLLSKLFNYHNPEPGPAWSVRCPNCKKWKDETDLADGHITLQDAEEDDGLVAMECDCGHRSLWIDGPGVLIPFNQKLNEVTL